MEHLSLTIMEHIPILLIIVVLILSLNSLKNYFRGPTFLGKKPDLSSKVAIVTGGNRGIGRQVVRDLAERGCKVIIADICNSEELAHELNAKTGKNLVRYVYIDLGNLQSVLQFANKIQDSKIDFLICNAAIMGQATVKMTKSKFQAHYGVNYVGHYYLIHLLWKKLNNSDFFRVICLSSNAHLRVIGFFKAIDFDFSNLNFQNGKYNRQIAYSRSKLYKSMLARALIQKIQPGKGIAVSVHPGIVRTNIAMGMLTRLQSIGLFFVRPIYWFLTKSPSEGAQTILHTLYTDQKQLKAGSYYADCKVAYHSPLIDQNYKLMFDHTAKILGIEQFGK